MIMTVDQVSPINQRATDEGPFSDLSFPSSPQILNTLPFGVGVAASARVGNLLGARSPNGARVSTQASVALSTIIGSIVLASLVLSRRQFGYLFSDEADVVALVADVLPYVAAFQIADGWAQRSAQSQLVSI